MKKIILLSIFFGLLISCVTNSYNPDNEFKKANSYYNNKNYQKSKEIIDTIISFDDSYEKAYFLKSLLEQNDKDYDIAIVDLQKAIALTGDSKHIYNFNLGNLYYYQEKYLLAIDQYSLAIEKKNDYLSARINRANAEVEIGRYSEAIIDYQFYIANTNDQKEQIERLIELLQNKLNDGEI